jgi:hypothetical protein
MQSPRRVGQLRCGRYRIILVMLAGCGRVEQDLQEKPAGISSEPQDSLAMASPGGEQVWFTLARTGRAPDGKTCIERGLEIRGGEKPIPIPLLYTAEAPVLLNDSTIRAVLWTDCQPGDAYRVDLRNGRPVREPAGGNQ